MRRNRIMLVYGVPYGVIVEQIGIASIASYMRERGYEVKILCLETVDDFFSEILNFNPDFLGFNTVTINIKKMAEISKIIKTKIEVTIFFGGIGASGNINDVMDLYNSVDYIIYGEGEVSVYELIERLRKQESIDGCKGIVHRKNGNIIIESPRELIKDLDILPFPARDIFIENRNRMKGFLSSVMLETARGCCANCSFCDNFITRQQKGAIWRGKSVKKVVDEVQYLTDELNIGRIHFQDRTFEDPGKLGMKRIQEIADEIIRRNIKVEFSICVRAENWTEKNRFILSKLIKAGLFSVQVGIENGNSRTLKLYNKRATLEDNVRVTKLLSELNLIIDSGFIMFHPYNTFYELRKNLAFLVENGLGHIKKNLFAQLELTPNTDLFKKIQKDKLTPTIFSGDTFNYTFIDKRIENMVKCLPKQASEDESIVICDNIHFELSYYLQKFSIIAKEDNSYAAFLNYLKKIKDDIFKELADLNKIYYLKLLDLAESGDSYEEIKYFIDKYDDSQYQQIYEKFKKIRFNVYFKLRKYNGEVLFSKTLV